MKKHSWMIAIAALSGSMCAAQSFDFKGNGLGMSLTEFKRANKTGVVLMNSGPLKWNGAQNKKFDRNVSLPLCTDEVNVFPGSSIPIVQDEVLCNTAPGTVEEGRLVLGEPITAVYYRFYKGKLYDIALVFDVRRFQEIVAAFREKYGTPTRVGSTAYQNAYGASWTGEEVTWLKGSQVIVAHEGSANGPVQSHYGVGSGSQIEYQDVSLAPKPEKPNIDF